MTDNSLMLEILKDLQLRFGRMEAKFDQVDERLGHMEERFDVVDAELAAIKADVSSLNRAFIRLDNRVDEQIKALAARVYVLEDH